MDFMKAMKREILSTAKNRDIIVLLVAGPIILTLLFGGIYVNSYVNDIPIAVLDEDGSTLSRMILQQFEESDRFVTRYYASSKEELESLINSKQAHMGVYIPHDFSKSVSTLAESQVLILADGSNLVVGNNAYAAAAEIVQTLSAGTQIKIIEAKGVLPKQAKNTALVFNFNDRILYDSRMTYMNYLILGFVAVFFQQVMLSGVGISIIKDQDTINRGHTWKNLLIKILACFFFASISTYAALLVSYRGFHVPMQGNLFLAMAFCLLYALAISCPAMILASLLRDKVKMAQIAYMLSLPSFVSCGYVWPLEQMPKALVAVIKLVWPLVYFARPFDEYLIKGWFSMRNLAELGIYLLLWLPFALFMVKTRLGKEKEENPECAMAAGGNEW